MLQGVSVACRVKFPLNIIPIFATDAAPSRYIFWIGGCIVAVAHFNSNKIRNK